MGNNRNLIYAVLFLAYAAVMASEIFIPTFAKLLGARESEVGIIVASYGLASFLSSYLSGRASDVIGNRKSFLIYGLFLSSLAFFSQIFAGTKEQLLFIRAIAGFSIGVFFPPLVAYASERGSKPGVLISFASFGWAFGSIVAGLIGKISGIIFKSQEFEFKAAFLISSVFLFVASYLSIKIKEYRIKPKSVPLFPFEIIKRNYNVYFSSLLRHLGAFAVWATFPIFLASLGASSFWIGAIYFVNTFSQGLIMRKLDIFDEVKLIFSGLFFSSLVFFLYTLAPNFYYVLPIQLILALSYSCLYVGSIAYLVKRNEEKATAVGVLSSFMGISTFLGPAIGGALTQALGFKATMYLASLLSLLGVFIMAMKRNS